MKGYFIEDHSKSVGDTTTGRLLIEVKNLPEFQNLISQAAKEADQLLRTIDQLSNFELKIDFNVGEITSVEKQKWRYCSMNKLKLEEASNIILSEAK